MVKIHSKEHNYEKITSLSQRIKQEEKKEFIEEFRTVESYNLDKLYILKAYLTDYLLTKSEKVFYRNRRLIVDTKYTKISRQLTIIDKILSTPDNYPMRAIRREGEVYFERFVPYGRLGTDSLTDEFKTGRMYSVITSMPLLTKQIRSYLFKNFYVDIDLVNAQPSILANSANIYNIDAPTLLEYVSNREAMLEEICLRKNIDRKQAKQEVLVAMNASEYNSSITFLQNLHRETAQLRLRLFVLYKHRKSRGLNVPILSELEQRLDFKEKSIQKKLSTFQSFYCFDKETELLLSLRKHFLKKLSISPSDSFLTQKNHLHFIPFFDGAYVAAKSDSNATILSDLMLENIVDEFNKSNNKFFQFKVDNLLDTEFSFLDPEILTEYHKNMFSDEYRKSHDFYVSNATLKQYINKENHSSDAKSLKSLVRTGLCHDFNDQILLEYALYCRDLRQSLRTKNFPDLVNSDIE